MRVSSAQQLLDLLISGGAVDGPLDEKRGERWSFSYTQHGLPALEMKMTFIQHEKSGKVHVCPPSSVFIKS